MPRFVIAVVLVFACLGCKALREHPVAGPDSGNPSPDRPDRDASTQRHLMDGAPLNGAMDTPGVVDGQGMQGGGSAAVDAPVSCDSSNCGVECGGGVVCEGRCGACCSAADCEEKPGFRASCEMATLTCQYRCPEDMKACGDRCVADEACCTDADCPPMDQKVGACDQSNGRCNWMCAAETKPCGNSGCIPKTGCCTDAECPGNTACQDNACSTSCRSGFKRCGNECIPASMCCRADGCCAHSDCGTCQKCVSGRCVNQGGNDDLKSECASGTCRTGNCNGNGGCGITPNGQQGPGCNGGASCNNQGAKAADSCQDGQCQSPGRMSCRHYDCGSNNRCRTSCPAGTRDTGSSCEECGGSGQQPCSGGTCDPGLVPDGGVCQACGKAFNQPCCPGNTCDPSSGHKCGQKNGQFRCVFPCGVELEYCCDSAPVCPAGTTCKFAPESDPSDPFQKQCLP